MVELIETCKCITADELERMGFDFIEIFKDDTYKDSVAMGLLIGMGYQSTMNVIKNHPPWDDMFRSLRENVNEEDLEKYDAMKLEVFKKAYDELIKKGAKKPTLAEVEEWSYKNDPDYVLMYALRSFFVEKDVNATVEKITVDAQERKSLDVEFLKRLWIVMDIIPFELIDYGAFEVMCGLYMLGLFMNPRTMNAEEGFPCNLFSSEILSKLDDRLKGRELFDSYMEAGYTRMNVLYFDDAGNVERVEITKKKIMETCKNMVLECINKDAGYIIFGIEKVMGYLAYLMLCDNIVNAGGETPPSEVVFHDNFGLNDVRNPVFIIIRCLYAMYSRMKNNRKDMIQYTDSSILGMQEGLIDYGGLLEKEVDDSVFGDMSTVLDEWNGVKPKDQPTTDAQEPSTQEPSNNTPNTQTPSNDVQTPPAQTPDTQTPPNNTPPAQTPPSQEPPSQEPSNTETPDVQTPLAQTPPSNNTPSNETPPPSNTPSNETSSNDPPPSNTPDVQTPDTQEPPAQEPDTQEQSNDTPSTDTPPTQEPDTQEPSTETPDTQTPSEETPSDETPDGESSEFPMWAIILIVLIILLTIGGSVFLIMRKPARPLRKRVNAPVQPRYI